MRVIAGEARGRPLRGPPPGSLTRPTPDRVREALFQILGPLEGERVLDLYAGTGALGIEALSRGAAAATFVELDRKVVRVLEQNLEKAGVLDRATIATADVLEALAARLPQAGLVDLALVDPPYRSGLLLRTLAALVTLLSPRGRVVAEHSAKDCPPEVPGLVRQETRRYGDTAISFYQLAPPEKTR